MTKDEIDKLESSPIYARYLRAIQRFSESVDAPVVDVDVTATVSEYKAKTELAALHEKLDQSTRDNKSLLDVIATMRGAVTANTWLEKFGTRGFAEPYQYLIISSVNLNADWMVGCEIPMAEPKPKQKPSRLIAALVASIS